METIRECHKRGVFHSDIKDENILIDKDSGRIRLIDFGSGKFLHDGIYFEFEGTRIYSPPEWISSRFVSFIVMIRVGSFIVDINNLHFRRYRAESLTVWSLGVLLYDMVCGDIPFDNDQQIVSNNLTWFRHLDLSDELKHLVSLCLCKEESKRITLKSVEKHPWLSQGYDDTMTESSILYSSSLE